MANDTLIFIENDKEYTLTMFSGITNLLLSYIDLNSVEEVLTNPELQTKWVSTMLSEYDDSGKVKGFVYSPFKLSNENRVKLISWGFEHITDFLLNTGKSLRKNEEKITKSSEVIANG